jgi:hypothetical protein
MDEILWTEWEKAVKEYAKAMAEEQKFWEEWLTF